MRDWTITRRKALLGAGAAGICAALPDIGAAARRTHDHGGKTMAFDLTGGLDPDKEYSFAEPQTTPGMRDAVNLWAWDGQGRIGFPRIAAEAVAPDWDTHLMHMSLTLPGGRVLRNWQSGPAHPVFGPDGKASRLGAGPIEFECIEPFRRYRATFKGTATDTTFDALVEEGVGAVGREADLEFAIDCEMTAPPWVQGSLRQEAGDLLAHSVEGDFMGGYRLEQLCRTTGKAIIDGVEHPFSGQGLRVRRQGVRNESGFWGHCWQSAQFPSGRAFGCNSYPPRPDGKPSFNEGYIFEGEGKLIGAKVVKAPWLTHLQGSGEDVSLTLETDSGLVEIAGELVMAAPTLTLTDQGFPPLTQSIVRYRWNGEEAYGMMERSNLRKNVKGLA